MKSGCTFSTLQLLVQLSLVLFRHLTDLKQNAETVVMFMWPLGWSCLYLTEPSDYGISHSLNKLKLFLNLHIFRHAATCANEPETTVKHFIVFPLFCVSLLHHFICVGGCNNVSVLLIDL